MTTKEKAKAYDEALEDMRVIYPNLKGDAKLAVEHAFPQLRESEDERIRKAIVKSIEEDSSVYEQEVSKESMLAWLEKQREQKEPHYTKRNTLFDKCVENCDPAVMKKVSDEIDEMLQKEQKPAEYLNKDMIYAIMNKLHDLSFSQLIPIDSDEFEKINEITGDVHKLLDYLIEQKPAEWSEEDEKMLNDCIMALSNWRDAVANYGHEVAPCQELIDWLKSIRPSWKPSEEELVALKRVGSILRDYGHSELAKTVFMVEGRLANLSVVNKSIWKPSEEQMDRLFSIIAALRKAYCDDMADFLANLRTDLKKLGVKEEPEYYQHFDPDC